ncbi:MAG: hypothetical protein JW757_02745, partial [Anaerolineales bacterium]|nr:hypothetical protein [Anaerolineales bacterium]
YETSLCHGWSAGPAVWLHQAVLGVKPGNPGFTRFHFQPNLGGLNWAEGDVPTPHGTIHVRLESRAGEAPSAWVQVPKAEDHPIFAIIPDSIQRTWHITILEK